MGLTTPLVLIASSAAVALCFAWSKKCAIKIYRTFVKPRWSAYEWEKHDHVVNDWRDGFSWYDGYYDRAYKAYDEPHEGFRQQRHADAGPHAKSQSAGGDTTGGQAGPHGKYQHRWEDTGSGGARSGGTTGSGGARSGGTTGGYEYGFGYDSDFEDWFNNFNRKYGQDGQQHKQRSYGHDKQRTGHQHSSHQQSAKSPYTRDPYEVLGVSRDASWKEIKKKRDKLALKYHPDKNPGDEVAAEKMKEVNAAYEEMKEIFKQSGG